MNEERRTFLFGLLGALVFVGLLELVGRAELVGKTWPPLSEIAAFTVDPAHSRFLRRALGATLRAAGLGAALGISVGALLAILALVLPVARAGLDRLAALVEAMPAIAIAPFLALSFGRDTTPVIIAAFGVGFIIYVSLSSAFAAIASTHHDLFSVFGASKLRRLVRLQLPSSLPGLFDGLALAVPAAILGAMIGEFFGAPRGLGVLVVSAMQNFQTTLLWSAAGLSVLCSLIGYVVLSYLQRRVSARFT